MIDDIMDVIDFWRVDSADEKTKNEIRKLSKWANIFVATNTSVCLICAASVFFSSDENDGLVFIHHVLDQTFFQWGKFAFVFFKITLFVASFTIPAVTYQVFYVTQHVTMQMKLFKMFIRSLASTLSSAEENLTYDDNYQEAIQTQLKIIIDRHCDFIR
jgi:archaellum biogenesis protein FlaJ (TadC family)